MTDNTPRTIIDLSHPLGPDTPAFPGDPSPEIRIFDSTEDCTPSAQRHLNCSHLSTSLHCGTHMDAPFHFFGDRATIDRVPLERTMGPALLIRLPWQQSAGLIDAEHLAVVVHDLKDVDLVPHLGERLHQPDRRLHEAVLSDDADELLALREDADVFDFQVDALRQARQHLPRL